MAYQSAREMLSRFPMKMAEGGSVDANQLVLDFITNNPDASVEAIATQINNSGADLYSLADTLNIDRSIAQEAYDEANALNQSYLDAETRIMGEINANPAAFNAADAYSEILKADAASERGVNVQGALDAGVAQSTIDRLFTTPAGSPAYTGPAPTATMSAGVQDYYNTVMADGEVDAAERLAMQKIATDQGLSYNDILAAGVDPNILYNTPAVEPIAPVVPDPVVPVVPDPFPQTQVPYTAPTVYQPLPDNTSVYAAGEESLDREFRDSAPRTEVLDPYGNLVNFDYTPGASLRSATGSGYNFTPPTVTSRPRSLMGADLLARYTGGRAAADLRQLTTGLGNGRSYSDYTGVLQNPGAYSGGLSKSQLYSRMRGMDYNRDRPTRATGTIADYLAKYEDVGRDYARAMEAGELLPGTTLESFGRDHYNKYGRFDRPFTLIEAAGDTGGGVTIGDPDGRFFFGEGDEESRQQDYTTSNFEQAQRAARSLGEAGGVYRPFAQGGPVKKPKGFADGGSASADLKALDSTDPLFITETVQEVNPDMVKREIPRMEWDGVNRPTPMETESRNMLETLVSGYPKAVNTVANYVVRGEPGVDMSLIPMGELASDTKALGGMLYEALKEDPVAFFAENLPVVAQIVAGRDMNEFTGLANEARASGDSGLADMYEQIVVLSAAGIIPGGAAANKAAKTTAIKAARDAAKATASDSARMLDEVDKPIVVYRGTTANESTVRPFTHTSTNPSTASGYAGYVDAAEELGIPQIPEEGGNVMKMLADVKNIATLEDIKRIAPETKTRQEAYPLLQKAGFDSYQDNYELVVFDPSDLKSAYDPLVGTDAAKMLDEVDAVNAPRVDFDFSTKVITAMQEIATRPSVANDPVAMRFLNQIMDDPDKAILQYARLDETNGGKIINTDLVRELSPDFLADRTLAFNVHQPASALSEIMFNRRVAETMGEEGTWIFTGGGPASGKTAGLSKEMERAADLVMDGTLAKFAKNDALIEKALESGKDVQIVYIDRDPLKALPLALMRAMESGRPVPLMEFARMHRDARSSVRQLHEKYKDNPNVDIQIVDNQGKMGEQFEITIDKLSEMDYDKTLTEGFKMLEEARLRPEKKGDVNGGISEAIYQGTKGNYDPSTAQSKTSRVSQDGTQGNQGNRQGVSRQQTGVNALEVGVDESLSGGQRLRNYTPDNLKTLEELATKATAGTRKADALINAPVEAGSKVGIRLNLNSNIPDAPKGLDKLQTLHKNNFNGKALSYVPYATVENVTFNVNQKGRQGIAAKISNIDVPEAKNKFPSMSVDGNYVSDKNVLLDGEDFVEIGFNPKAHHLFINMNTGQAVKGADLATVVGDRVYARGIQYYKKSEAPDPLKASDGTDLPSQVRYQKMKSGGSVERVYNDNRKYK